MYDIIIDDEISVWGYGAKKHRENLSKLEGDINIFLSSYGGDVYEAIDIYNMNREYSKAKGEVTVTVGSKAMSAGAIITMSADKKKAHKNSTFMIHRAWTFTWGNAVDLEKTSKTLNAIDGIQARDFSKAMGKTSDEVMELLTADTYYIGESELLETGIFDEIIGDDEVSDTKQSASNSFASAKKEFLAKVEEKEHKPDLTQAKKAILNCSNGECQSAVVNTAVPTAQKSDKPANKIQGDDMTDKDIMASEPYTKLVASHEEQVKAIQGKLNEVNASLAEMKTKVDAQEAWAKQLPEVCAMAISRNVSKDTLVAMVTAGDITKAKASVVDGMETEGAFGAKEESKDAEKENNAKVFEDKAKALGITFIGGNK